MKRIGLLVSGFIASTTNYAFPTTVFDAELECQKIQTQKGVRFVPECDFHSGRYTPDFNHQLAPDSVLKQALYKSKLTYQFSCESLMPLSISYSINEGVEVRISGNLAGSRNDRLYTSELTHGFNQATLNLTRLSGAVGFQAIKPGCHLTLEAFVSYPEPHYFKLLVDSKVQLDRVLARSLEALAPDANYTQALAAMENSIFMLDFMAATADDLTALQIEETISELNTTKDQLTVGCTSGSSSHLCTQGIATARRVLSQEIKTNESSMLELKRTLDFQLNRLSVDSSALGDDCNKLREVQTTLTGYLNL